jgi:hypothetical protein
MAEPLPTSTDKLLTVPPYLDGLQQVKLERLSDEVHRIEVKIYW